MSAIISGLFRNCVNIVPVIFCSMILIFLSIHLIPGDPVDLLVMEGAGSEERQLVKHALGLDQPLPIQFYIYLKGIVTGNLGRSIYSRRPVLELISQCYWATLQLSFCAMIVALLIGITSGVVAAFKKDSIWDHIFRLIAFFGISVPPFLLALLAIFLFSVKLDLLPVFGTGGIQHLILPSITLGLYTAAMISRFTYGSMLEVMNQDYIRTARMKGCNDSRVLFIHALKNAMIPTVTVVGLQFGYLLAGTVWIETIFAWPGIGALLVKAVLQRDYPLMQGICIIIVITFLFLNMIVDTLYAYLDPRLRNKS